MGKMRKYVFAMHGAAVFAAGLLLGWVSYDFALASGNMLELAMTLLSLPMLYFGLSIIKEYEFASDGLIVRQPAFLDSAKIPYAAISDVRLTYMKFYGTPRSYTLTIMHSGGSEKVGFGFGIDDGFLKCLEERVGGDMVQQGCKT